MNPDQSFYGYEDWHLPSPSSTPQTLRLAQSPFGTPNQAFSTPRPGVSWFPSPEYHRAQENRAGTPPAQSSLSSSTLKRTRLDGTSNHGHASPSKDASQSFVTTSFLGKLENTTLDEQNDTSQMRTPPPTRDASSRRKPQQKEMKFATPSTIHSRRMSEDSWLKRNGTSTISDPFHFSPSDDMMSSDPFTYTNTGALTAPAYSQAGLFWDPKNTADFSMSTIDEVPFMPASFVSPQSALFASSAAAPPSVTSNTPMRKSSSPVKSLEPRSTGALSKRRPQSFALSSKPNLFSGVDPSMLSLPTDLPHTNLGRSRSFSSKPSDEPRQPYQFHLDEMRRERAQKASRRLVRGGPVESASFTAPDPSLRRSLTDARNRTNHSNRLSNASSVDLQDLTASLHEAQLRSASPLKRQRTNSIAPSKIRVRRSVVLTVDDSGTARTEVKVVKSSDNDDAGESESSDDELLPVSRPLAVAINDGTSSSDAQTALKDVMRTRQRRQGSQSSLNSTSMSTFNGSMSRRDTSQASAVIRSVGWEALSSMHPEGLSVHEQGRRCVCGGYSEAGQPLIQCASCNNVLHMDCCGLDPLAPPHGFICPICIDEQDAQTIHMNISRALSQR